MRMLINVYTFNRFICLHMRLIILSLACIGFLISDRCHVRFATLVDNKRDVRDDIEYTWTNLKIVRLGIARTHGWVELAQTVPTSSSQRSSTVFWKFLCPSLIMAGALSVTPVRPYFTDRRTSVPTSPLSKLNNFDQNFMKLGHIV